MRWMSLAVSAATLAFLCTFVAAQEPLFQDNFADLTHWNAPPEWRVADGALTVAGGDINLCKLGGDWRNYALEFDVTVRRNMAEWVIRAARPQDCCFIQLTSEDCPYSPNTLRYHTWRDGKLGSIKEDSLPAPIKLGQTYHVRCEVVGGTVRTFLDGKPRGQWDFGAGYDTGTIGFRASTTEEAEYRNLKVLPCESLSPVTITRKPQPRVVEHDAFLNPAFRAEWIWGAGDRLDRAFRHSFDLPAQALEARLWITADNAYELFANGQRVGAGDSWQSPTVYDLKPFLRPGRNVLAVAGHNAAPGAAGLLAEGNVLCADATNVPLQTDAAWLTSDAPAAGWEQPEFVATGWLAATSAGRHPQEPWAGQADWVLPYLGPLVLGEAQGVTLAGPLSASTPAQLTVRAQFTNPPKTGSTATAQLPARVLLKLPSGEQVIVAQGYGRIDKAALAGEGLRLTLAPVPGLWLPAGEYPAQVELVGIFFGASAARLQATATWVTTPHPAPLPLAKRPMGPGLFTDQFGGAHRYSVDGSWLTYDNQKLSPLAHGGGAYWCLENAAQAAAVAASRDVARLAEIRKQGLTEEPVRVRLLDSIECADPASEAAHQFGEDDGFGGQSRLLKIGETTYRVTDNRHKLSYFAYTMHIKHPGKAHLLVFETPNDRERYTLVRIQPPWRNIGCGPYTGRDMPCDGKPYQAGFIFYPEAEDVRLTVSRLPCELKTEPESGGAVSRLWLFELADEPGTRRAEMAPTPGPARRIGLSLTHSAYLYDLYGNRQGDVTRRLASLNAFADYAEFAGLNLLEFNAVNGADTSEMAYYPSKIWNQYGKDVNLPVEFLPMAQGRDIAALPCLTSLAFDIDRFTDAPWISPLTFQIDRDGFRRRDFFAGRGNSNALPDPLRPEVQKVFLDSLREIGEACKASPAVTGLAFRMNGKIGTCYVGYNEDERAATAGFSPWDMAQFQQDTGVRIPGWEDSLTERWVAAWKAGNRDDPAVRFIPQAYEWLRANAWEKWTDWRCHRMTDLILKARDLTRSLRPDWNLVVKCDMPSETPDRNILWPAGAKPLDLLRDHGLDPRLLAGEPGIILQQGYFIGGGEYFHSSPGSAYDKNPAAWATFDYQPGLAELYRTTTGTSAEFYHNYWEENGASPMGEFGTSFWGAGMMYPRGRAFFRPMLHAIITNNVQSLALFSWERGSEGHEGELRRFSRAFRALPAVAAEPFSGPVQVLTGSPTDDTLWVRRFGPRVALVNQSAEARSVRLTVTGGKLGQALYEYASQRRLGVADAAGSAAVTVELEPYDLRVLGFE